MCSENTMSRPNRWQLAGWMLPLWALLLVSIWSSCHRQPPANPEILLNKAWKFTTGDNLQYARPEFDDSHWQTIRVDATWNKQGFPQYQGFAWYRIRFFLPSSLREKSALQDSLVFHMGRIDDFDQVFLNGELIGENLRTVPPGTPVTDAFSKLNYTLWDKPRRYALAADDPRIRWDAENVLAVRVYDWGVAGGIYSGDLYIAMADITEYVKLDNQRFRFRNLTGALEKEVRLFNHSRRYPARGELSVGIRNNLTEQTVLRKTFSVHLAAGDSAVYHLQFPETRESTTIFYTLSFENSRRTIKRREGIPYRLTPPTPPEPRINYPRIYGQRAGRPFLFRIPVSGKRPMRFSAQGLPPGLLLDAENGILRGSVHQKGTYSVTVIAENQYGRDQQIIELVIGDTIALTPPMGWNSWNCWGLSVNQERIRDAAQAFVETGLADHGWSFINIDDGWEIEGKSGQPGRTPDGEIRTNEKFPDMKRLGEQIHRFGLKFGIYSSPGPLTCGGYTASYGHEEQDARTFARWGVDYLKYDLCSYRKFMKDVHDPAELIPPYRKMWHALRKQPRDIVYSLCEYGYGKVWEWGASVGGNLWRTTGDIWDDWDRMVAIGFSQVENAPYAGPGHWNDPDMLVIGWVGWGEHLHPTYLTPDEQYTHVSLWALLSAPLLLGCDLTRLDDFTLGLITNDEVIAINQDKLGKQAVPVIREDSVQVWVKPLWNGDRAIGIFNLSGKTRQYRLPLRKSVASDSVRLRDVWRQKELGVFAETFSTTIPPHGVVLLRAKRTEAGRGSEGMEGI